MKKFILISLVIIFAICSKSWSQSAITSDKVENTNIICKKNEFVEAYVIRKFDGVKNIDVSRSYPFELIYYPCCGDYYNYYADPKFVRFSSGYVWYKINRKTLVFESSVDDTKTWKIKYKEGECKIVKDFRVDLKEKSQEYRRRYEKEKEGNQF